MNTSRCPQCDTVYTQPKKFCGKCGIPLIFEAAIPESLPETHVQNSQPDLTPTQHPQRSKGNPVLIIVVALLVSGIGYLGYNQFVAKKTQNIPATLNNVVNEALPSTKTVGSAQIAPTNVQDSRNSVRNNARQEVNASLPGDYPEASTVILDNNYIQSKSKNELRLIRNEIFARHGYIFKTADMKNHFGSKSWYVPKYPNINNMLSTIEKTNVEAIKRHE